MASDRERIKALERTVRLLAETTRDLIAALHEQMHEETFENRDYTLRRALARAEGRLDAALSTLGVGEGDHGAAARGQGGGGGEGDSA